MIENIDIEKMSSIAIQSSQNVLWALYEGGFTTNDGPSLIETGSRMFVKFLMRPLKIDNRDFSFDERARLLEWGAAGMVSFIKGEENIPNKEKRKGVRDMLKNWDAVMVSVVRSAYTRADTINNMERLAAEMTNSHENSETLSLEEFIEISQEGAPSEEFDVGDELPQRKKSKTL